MLVLLVDFIDLKYWGFSGAHLERIAPLLPDLVSWSGTKRSAYPAKLRFPTPEEMQQERERLIAEVAQEMRAVGIDVKP
jgi:hypothetical protein